MSKQKEESGVQKLRERHERIKKSIKPSKELLEIFSKEDRSNVKGTEQRKVAKTYTPEVGI